LILDSISLYDSSGNQDLHLASALVLKELSRHANELFKGNLTVVLPLAFVAKFDEEKDISGIFEEIWEDNISSTSVALGLYMPEIVARLKEGIGSSSWPQKKKVSISVHSFCLHSLFWSWMFCQVLSYVSNSNAYPTLKLLQPVVFWTWLGCVASFLSFNSLQQLQAITSVTS
jgi:hypothetical protein